MKIQGFTLIELLVTISILALVFGAIVTSMSAIQKNGRDAQRQADLRNTQSALQNYYADQQFFPTTASVTFGGSLSSDTGNPSPPASKKTYLSTIPKDPVPGTATPYCYYAQISAANPASCDNTVNNKCQYYRLYSQLENPPDGATSSTCSGKSYNFQVNPI